jgi:uncharacterized BrkB/YihY/UPF0761 family membrane protein
MTPTNPLWMIATTQAANSHHHQHQHSPDENTQLLAMGLSIIILSLLWIVFTSIRQLFKKDVYYDFVDENIGALIMLGIMATLTLLVALTSLIYTLIK